MYETQQALAHVFDIELLAPGSIEYARTMPLMEIRLPTGRTTLRVIPPPWKYMDPEEPYFLISQAWLKGRTDQSKIRTAFDREGNLHLPRKPLEPNFPESSEQLDATMWALMQLGQLVQWEEMAHWNDIEADAMHTSLSSAKWYRKQASNARHYAGKHAEHLDLLAEVPWADYARHNAPPPDPALIEIIPLPSSRKVSSW